MGEARRRVESDVVKVNGICSSGLQGESGGQRRAGSIYCSLKQIGGLKTSSSHSRGCAKLRLPTGRLGKTADRSMSSTVLLVSAARHL